MKHNIRAIEKLAGESFKNDLRLHTESLLLFKDKHFASAFFLSVVALEEFGKALYLDDRIWNHIYNKTPSTNFNDEVMACLGKKHVIYGERVNAHHLKQGAAVLDHQSDVLLKRRNHFGRLVRSVMTKQIDAKKQNSLYVGLSRKNGHLLIPTKLNRWRVVQRQITIVNDLLIDFEERKLSGHYEVTTQYLRRAVNKRVYGNLMMWDGYGKHPFRE